MIIPFVPGKSTTATLASQAVTSWRLNPEGDVNHCESPEFPGISLKLKSQFDIHLLVAILPDMKLSWILGVLLSACSRWAESKLQSISLKDINGKATSLKEYDGQVLW